MVRDMGDTAAHMFDDMSADEQDIMSQTFQLGKLPTRVVHSFRKVVRLKGNPLLPQQLPPLLPFLLVKMRGRNFLQVIREYRNQVRTTRDKFTIAKV